MKRCIFLLYVFAVLFILSANTLWAAEQQNSEPLATLAYTSDVAEHFLPKPG